MDPKFRSIRLTESCKFWIWDTFRLRKRALQAVQEASRERDMASRPEDSRRRSISNSLRMVPWLWRESALSEAATTTASSAPGHQPSTRESTKLASRDYSTIMAT
ncbi:hypothetical protein PENPOL_c016G02290 [Penicillium polonicum]|uniref:Uncharacterized protein n=1 Tax=Penicillium polonicum TaxID=60169 RepID=A0A1V6NAD8_PENPO|nr:hypothetical protein PENPOL_c016G02290 [Penicillium polonicum]